MNCNLPVWAQILLDEPARSQRPSAAMFREDSHKACLVLIAHGSRDPRWREPFERMERTLEARSATPVRLAYMEFVSPTLMEVARECVEMGARHIRVMPLFLASGAHVATDIPEQVEQVRTEFPMVCVELVAPIGEDPRVFALLETIVLERAAEMEFRRRALAC